MKLYDLKNILKFTVDFADNEVCGSVYFEIEEVCDKYAKQIEVVEINENCIVCKFTDFLRNHKTALNKYICDNMEDEYIAYYQNQLICYEKDITEDGGEAVYSFIKNELEYFLANSTK